MNIEKLLGNFAFAERHGGVDWATNGHFVIRLDRFALPFEIGGLTWKVEAKEGGRKLAEILSEPDEEQTELIDTQLVRREHGVLTTAFLIRRCDSVVVPVNPDYLRLLLTDSIKQAVDCMCPPKEEDENNAKFTTKSAIRFYERKELIGLAMPMQGDAEHVNEILRAVGAEPGQGAETGEA